MTALNLFGEPQELPRDLVRVRFTIEDTDTGEESWGTGTVERSALDPVLADPYGEEGCDVEVTEWEHVPDFHQRLAVDLGVSPRTVYCTRDELEVLP